MSIASDSEFYKKIAIMTLSQTFCGKPIKEKLVNVLQAVLEAGSSGMTTRNIADRCDISVYSARSWLLILENKGLILRNESVRNTHWYHSL